MGRRGHAGEPVRENVSTLLRAWSDGDQGALARLTPVVYDELRHLAHRSSDVVALDDALNALAERARKAKVVELRFFGGLSVDEIAEVLHVSSMTVMREWKSAKAWLYRELGGPTANGQRTLE